MDKIRMSYKEYEEMFEVFDTLPPKAKRAFANVHLTKEVIDECLERDPEYYIKYLMYIDETGQETSENRDVRNYLRSTIKKVLKIEE